MSDEIKAAVDAALKAEKEKTEGYVKGIREEAKGYRTKLETLTAEFTGFKADAEKTAREAAEAAAKAGDGKYEGLYEVAKQTIADLEVKIKELEGTITASAPLSEALDAYLKAEIEEIPEDKRSLIPNLPTTDKLAWLKTAKAGGIFGELKKPGAPGHKPSGEQDDEKNNPWTTEHFNLTRQGQITRDQPALAEKLKKAAGK